MVRNIVVLGGSSHPSLNAGICDKLGIPPGNVRPPNTLLRPQLTAIGRCSCPNSRLGRLVSRSKSLSGNAEPLELVAGC